MTFWIFPRVKALLQYGEVTTTAGDINASFFFFASQTEKLLVGTTNNCSVRESKARHSRELIQKFTFILSHT